MQEKKIDPADVAKANEVIEKYLDDDTDLATAKRREITSPVIYSEKKRHRNDPCSCGSGRKYKHCCEKKIASEKRHYYA